MFFFFLQKRLKFCMPFSIEQKNNTLYFFRWFALPSRRNNVCKQPSVFQAASFGDLLLNEKQKKPFVSVNHACPHHSPPSFLSQRCNIFRRAATRLRNCFLVIKLVFTCFLCFRCFPNASGYSTRMEILWYVVSICPQSQSIVKS